MSAPAGVVDGLLAGRYRLSSRLAAGAMGEVWRARDLLLDREVAVKTLRPELADDELVRARFRAEASSTARLAHPGIAAVYDVGEAADGRAWIVLELVEGESLQSVLRREGRLSAERTLDVVVQTAAALQAAHDSGVVHRDVKPGNLLVREDGVLKVTDFGIASVAGTARLTGTGQVIGTAAYMSPEQADGAPATPASDLYALGVVAYECLSGTVPFSSDTPVAVLLAHLRSAPPALPDDVPGPLRELVQRLLAKDPQERPASARDLVLAAQAARARTGGAPAALAAATPPPAPTAVLAPPAPAPARPPRVVRQPAAGLSGRPGQRWAVRATALLLGLLAVALGLRETAGEPRRPAPSQAPSAPAAPTAPSTAPSTPPAAAPPDTAGAPAAPAPAAPGQPQQQAEQPAQQPPAQQEPAQQQQPAPPAAEPAPAQPDAQDRAEDAADEAADRAEKDAEKAQKDAEKAQDEAEDRGEGGGEGGGDG